jgi:hypothetical protein
MCKVVWGKFVHGNGELVRRASIIAR